MRSRVITVIDCGVSISGVSVLVAVTARLATKPCTGPVGDSFTSVAVTVTAGNSTCCCGCWASAGATAPAPSSTSPRPRIGRAWG